MILYQLFIAAYPPPQNLAASEKNNFICSIWAVPSWVIFLISPGTIHEASVIWRLNWCRTVSFTCLMFVPAVCEASFSPMSLVLKEASRLTLLHMAVSGFQEGVSGSCKTSWGLDLEATHQCILLVKANQKASQVFGVWGTIDDLLIEGQQSRIAERCGYREEEFLRLSLQTVLQSPAFTASCFGPFLSVV